jgi:hypothetical protein
MLAPLGFPLNLESTKPAKTRAETQKSPSPSNAERGAMFHKGAKYSFMGYPCDISHLSLISGREFEFHDRKLITVKCCR